MIAIGVGANSKARADDFAVALASICAETGGDVVATLAKAPFADLLKAAASRQPIAYRELPLVELQKRNEDCRTHSARTLDLFGVGSLAEASALVVSLTRLSRATPARKNEDAA